MLSVIFVIGAVLLYLLVGGVVAGLSVGFGFVKTEIGMLFSAILWPLWLVIVLSCYIVAFVIGICVCAWAACVRARKNGGAED